MRQQNYDVDLLKLEDLIAPEVNYLREMNRGSAHSELYLYYKK